MFDRYAPTPQPQFHTTIHHHEPPTIPKPMSREDIDEVGNQIVGRWESVPARSCIACCVLDIEVAFNTYAPLNDGDPYVTESETTGACCFCFPIHEVGLMHTNPEGMITTEKSVGMSSRELTIVPVHHARDVDGTLVVTERGTGVVQAGRGSPMPTTITQKWRLSRIRDSTMTWEQQTPNRVAVEFRKVSRAHATMSERFRAKIEALRRSF